MKHCVLIGFMGSGKTTLARLLSSNFFWPLFSTDEAIEQQMQMSITEIFKTYGEAFFRQKEKEIFQEILKLQKPHIIDCGGGFGVNQNVNALGKVIFLDLPFEVILQRLSLKEREKRPLFGDLEIAKALFNQRREIYKIKADEILKEWGEEKDLSDLLP